MEWEEETFSTENAARMDIQLRLIKDDEFFPLQRAPEFIFKIEAFGCRGVQAG